MKSINGDPIGIHGRNPAIDALGPFPLSRAPDILCSSEVCLVDADIFVSVLPVRHPSRFHDKARPWARPIFDGMTRCKRRHQHQHRVRQILARVRARPAHTSHPYWCDREIGLGRRCAPRARTANAQRRWSQP